MKMIKKLLSDWCGKSCNLNEIEYRTVQCGIEIMLNSALKILGILAIGLIAGEFLRFGLILLVMCSTRYFAGGRHCRTHTGCFLAMLGICILGTCFQRYVPMANTTVFSILVCFVIVLMSSSAPYISKVNPLDEDLINGKRAGSIMVSAIWLAIGGYYTAIGYCVLVPLIIECFTIISFGKEDKS